jgi:hypothetical protein
MSFKNIILNDLNVIFNPDEFSDVHNINGRPMTIIIDDDQLTKRSKVEYQGISVGEVLYFVNAAEYGVIPKQEEYQEFDGRPMYVFDAREDDGIYEIILHQNRG